MPGKPLIEPSPIRRAALLLAVALTAAGTVLVWSGRPLVFMPGRGELSMFGIQPWVGWLAGVGLLLAFVSALDAFFRGSIKALMTLWTGWAMGCIGLVVSFWILVRDLILLREAVMAPGSGVSAAEAGELLGSLRLRPTSATLVALLAVVPVAVFVAGWRRGRPGRP